MHRPRRFDMSGVCCSRPVIAVREPPLVLTRRQAGAFGVPAGAETITRKTGVGLRAVDSLDHGSEGPSTGDGGSGAL